MVPGTYISILSCEMLNLSAKTVELRSKTLGFTGTQDDNQNADGMIKNIHRKKLKKILQPKSGSFTFPLSFVFCIYLPKCLQRLLVT